MIDLSNSSVVLEFLKANGYFLIFLLMVVEGPIVTYVGAFLASLNVFSIYWVLILSILGNVVMDVIYYLAGRAGKKIFTKRDANKKIGVEKADKIKDLFHAHPGKTLLAVKLTPFLSVVGLTLAGTAKVPFRKFLFYSAVVSSGYSLALTLLGFFSSVAFQSIYPYVQYAGLLIAVLVLILIIFIFLVNKAGKSIANKVEKI